MQETVTQSAAAAAAEIGEWIVELQEETLQTLCALRLILSSAMKTGSADELQRAAGETRAHLEEEISRLRALVIQMQEPAADSEPGRLS